MRKFGIGLLILAALTATACDRDKTEGSTTADPATSAPAEEAPATDEPAADSGSELALFDAYEAISINDWSIAGDISRDNSEPYMYMFFLPEAETPEYDTMTFEVRACKSTTCAKLDTEENYIDFFVNEDYSLETGIEPLEGLEIFYTVDNDDFGGSIRGEFIADFQQGDNHVRFTLSEAYALEDSTHSADKLKADGLAKIAEALGQTK